jgi:hypothetical protein
MAVIGCAILGQPPDLPDAGEGACCIGAAFGGKDRCTCWEAVYDLDQQQLRPGGMGLRVKMCPDCAYRPASPERRGEEGYQGDPEFLDELVLTGEFFACHQGIRRPVKWVHPSGAEIPGHPAGYAPPLLDGVPYKADGTPADLCAGWAARRLKHMWREQEAKAS